MNCKNVTHPQQTCGKMQSDRIGMVVGHYSSYPEGEYSYCKWLWHCWLYMTGCMFPGVFPHLSTFSNLLRCDNVAIPVRIPVHSLPKAEGIVCCACGGIVKFPELK